MPRATKPIRLTADEVRVRLQNVKASWLREQRLLMRQHGERWHSPLHCQTLEKIESKGRELTRQLARHPDWWTLPCECKACASELKGEVE